MHFLIGLGIVVGLVAFAFGVNTARKIVIGMFGVAALAVVSFFGYLAYDIARDAYGAKLVQGVLGSTVAFASFALYVAIGALRDDWERLRADWESTKSDFVREWRNTNWRIVGAILLFGVAFFAAVLSVAALRPVIGASASNTLMGFVMFSIIPMAGFMFYRSKFVQQWIASSKLEEERREEEMARLEQAEREAQEAQEADYQQRLAASVARMRPELQATWVAPQRDQSK